MFLLIITFPLVKCHSPQVTGSTQNTWVSWGEWASMKDLNTCFSEIVSVLIPHKSQQSNPNQRSMYNPFTLSQPLNLPHNSNQIGAMINCNFQNPEAGAVPWSLSNIIGCWFCLVIPYTARTILPCQVVVVIFPQFFNLQHQTLNLVHESEACQNSETVIQCPRTH